MFVVCLGIATNFPVGCRAGFVACDDHKQPHGSLGIV